jgi:hydroxycarboxylate dehydrogenase B
VTTGHDAGNQIWRIIMGVTVAADRLETLIARIFEHTTCAPDEAALIARYLVDANLTGHDSHGVLRTMRYVTWLESGTLHAGRKIRIVSENASMAIIDGDYGMGHWVANQAVNFGIERAKANGTYITALRNAGHIGRVGSWALNAAEQGLVSIHFVNARGSVLVAPYGGIDRRFSTAPFCIGVPRNDAPPVILDFATSIVAEGKVMVAAKGGKKLPAGALIDAGGNLTEDPVALYGPAGPDAPPHLRDGKGAIRAFGDHKGSGLALMCELLGGALTGNGTAGPPGRPFANGMLSIYLRVDAVDDLGTFAPMVAEYVDFVTSAKPADPSKPVLVPGDPERAMAAERRANGVPLPDDAWASIREAAQRVGINDMDFTEIAGV